MTKRLLCALLSAMMLFGLCACSLFDPPKQPEPIVPVSTEPVETEEQTEEQTTAEAQTTEPEEETTAVPEPPAPIYNKDDTFAPGVLTVCNSDYEVPEELQSRLFGVMNEPGYASFTTAFYVLDLDSQMSIGYNADEYYQTACTIKAGYALSWFETLEQNRIANEEGKPLAEGETRVLLDDTYVYTGADYLPGAGRIQYSGTGVTYTISDILYHLINESDNTAYNILYNRIFGNEAYKALTERLGIVPYAGQYGMWTRMRPKDLGLVWQEIWNYHHTGSPEADLYWKYLTHNEFCEIGKVVKDADEIAHKSGSDDYGFHEAGLVVRDGHQYVVAVITTRPLSICNDDYDCCHKVIEVLDAVMKDYYAQSEEN